MRKLAMCGGCGRHVFVDEAACPFSALHHARLQPDVRGRSVLLRPWSRWPRAEAKRRRSLRVRGGRTVRP